VRPAAPIALDGLRHFPLPSLDGAHDKDGRGQILVVAGGRAVPGAAILTGVAALRAGAGKLQLAASADRATALGLAVPEAAVILAATDANGEFTAAAAGDLRDKAQCADAVTIGPGLVDEALATALACALIDGAPDRAFLVDAGALTGLIGHADVTRRLNGRLVVTPHAGEMARLSGRDKREVLADPLGVARAVAARLQAVVALKGPDTFVVTPSGEAFRHEGGGVGLATSGSGDVLAGVIGGLLARGAGPLTATLWGVCVHGAAGAELGRQIGRVGFLARELLDVTPRVLARAEAAI
jgi:hydroxyethylthiazole kinase-like uncharacterized protein yjeF